MTSPSIAILAAARTPTGNPSDSLSSFSTTELGGLAMGAALEQAALSGDQVDDA